MQIQGGEKDGNIARCRVGIEVGHFLERLKPFEFIGMLIVKSLTG